MIEQIYWENFFSGQNLRRNCKYLGILDRIGEYRVDHSDYSLWEIRQENAVENSRRCLRCPYSKTGSRWISKMRQPRLTVMQVMLPLCVRRKSWTMKGKAKAQGCMPPGVFSKQIKYSNLDCFFSLDRVQNYLQKLLTRLSA